MKAFHKRRCDAEGTWMDVDDLVTETIARDAREYSRGEGQGALERAQEHANQCSHMLARLIDQLTHQGVLTAYGLHLVIDPEGDILETKP